MLKRFLKTFGLIIFLGYWFSFNIGLSLACTTYEDGTNDCSSGETCVGWVCMLRDAASSCKVDTDCTKDGKAGNCQPYKDFRNTQCFYPTSAPTTTAAQTTDLLEDLKIAKPLIEINIPNLNLSDVKNAVTQDEEGNVYLQLPWIGEYIAALYRFAVIIASIFAVVMVIKKAFDIVMSGGGEEKVAAYKRIGQIVIGLVLVWGSYVLLYYINPDLIKFRVLSVRYIEGVEFAGESFDTAGAFTGDTATAQKIGINCPGSGGAAALPGIVNSFSGKVVYRMGGKGGPPPYKEFSDQYKSFNDNCPSGNICLDCASFVQYLYKCAGLPPLPDGTSGLFGNAEKISSVDYNANKVNGKDLQIGDVIGWTADDPGNEFSSGHAVMYIGEGKIVETAGGLKNRQNPNNPRIRNFSSVETNKKYMFRWIRRL